MSQLSHDRLEKKYGASTAVASVSIEVADGELVVLLGPSGCGKTTTLRMVAGFVDATAGDVRLDGRSIIALPPHRREMGLVFQSYALFPHMTVARNIAFGLEMRRMNRAAIDAQVTKMLQLARLEPLANRFPRQLSGGQQQRVALARALAISPRVLLLDEPLSNLDAALRAEVGRDIRLLQRASGLTTIMVTHDQDEAMAMADRLVLMKDGAVEQAGTQEDLYERPATPFVAGFIGRSNLVPATRATNGSVTADGAHITLAGHYPGTGPCTLALRPERLNLGAATPGSGAGASAGAGAVQGTVELASYLGATREHLVRIGPSQRLLVRDLTAGTASLHTPGEPVTLTWDIGAERLFDGAGHAVGASP